MDGGRQSAAPARERIRASPAAVGIPRGTRVSRRTSSRSTAPTGPSLKCGGALSTWLDNAGHELHPINCVTFYVSYAFCIWDGGRLPTEAEFEFAAAGGSDDRLYPWGDTPVPVRRRRHARGVQVHGRRFSAGSPARLTIYLPAARSRSGSAVSDRWISSVASASGFATRTLPGPRTRRPPDEPPRPRCDR